MAQNKYEIKMGDWTYEVYVEKSPKYSGGYFKIRATRPYSILGRNWYKREESEKPEKIMVDLEVYVDRRKSLVDYLFFREGKANIQVKGEFSEYFKKEGWKKTEGLTREDLLDPYNLNLWSRDIRKIVTSEWSFLAKYFEKEIKKRRNRRYERRLRKIFKIDPETLLEGMGFGRKYSLEKILSTV